MLAVGTRHILAWSGDEASGQSKEPVLIFQPLQPLKKILLRLRRGFKEFSMDRHVKQ